MTHRMSGDHLLTLFFLVLPNNTRSPGGRGGDTQGMHVLSRNPPDSIGWKEFPTGSQRLLPIPHGQLEGTETWWCVLGGLALWLIR